VNGLKSLNVSLAVPLVGVVLAEPDSGLHSWPNTPELTADLLGLKIHQLVVQGLSLSFQEKRYEAIS
jgi:hypothetical protein